MIEITVLIIKLEECSEMLIKLGLLQEANILLAVIGLLQRGKNPEVEEIEHQILKDLEVYYHQKLKGVK